MVVMVCFFMMAVIRYLLMTAVMGDTGSDDPLDDGGNGVHIDIW